MDFQAKQAIANKTIALVEGLQMLFNLTNLELKCGFASSEQL
jgi:hypothetical protein